MPVELFLAWRYLGGARRRAHVAFVSLVTLAGLALGVAALVISLALLTGFQDRIRTRLARDTPALRIAPAASAFFSDPAAVRRVLAGDPDVREIRRVVELKGWLADPDARTALPARIRAEDDLPDGQARISASMSGQIGVGRGSLAQVVAARTELSPIGPIPVSVPIRVRDILRPSVSETAPDVVVSVRDASVLSGRRDAVSAFESNLLALARTESAAARLSRALGPAVRVTTWMQMHAGLSFALRMEKILIFATVFLIVVVASFSLVADLALILAEKRTDLGVLSTLGAPPALLGRIFAWLGLSIGAIGTVAGVAVGAAVSWALDRYALVPLPADVYLLSHVPFTVHPADVAAVLAVSLAAAGAAALLPVFAARDVGPAEALRLSQ